MKTRLLDERTTINFHITSKKTLNGKDWAKFLSYAKQRKERALNFDYLLMSSIPQRY